MKRVILLLVLISLTISVIDATDKDVENDVSDKTESPQDDSGDANVDTEKLDYARGSVCGYCSYCQFCKLCDKDCPCETSHTKPNCRMCKYCKFCYLCSAFCDTVCTPGGILDRVSGAIVNSLPSFNKDEVDDDIDSVKHWIDQKRDEL